MTVSFPVGDIAATFLRLPGFDPGDDGFLILAGQLRFHKASIGKNGSLCLYRTASGHHAAGHKAVPATKKTYMFQRNSILSQLTLPTAKKNGHATLDYRH
jgi:hypothetical protein